MGTQFLITLSPPLLQSYSPGTTLPFGTATDHFGLMNLLKGLWEVATTRRSNLAWCPRSSFSGRYRAMSMVRYCCRIGQVCSALRITADGMGQTWRFCCPQTHQIDKSYFPSICETQRKNWTIFHMTGDLSRADCDFRYKFHGTTGGFHLIQGITCYGKAL